MKTDFSTVISCDEYQDSWAKSWECRNILATRLRRQLQWNGAMFSAVIGGSKIIDSFK